MIADAAIFAAGLGAWSLLEYVIHGWMSHTFRTFASPLHEVHHRDPRRVFTIGAWLPVALGLAVGLALWGFAAGMIFYGGMAVGFTAYEALHYRIHFTRGRGRIETYLRERHLVHHYRDANRCFGVTSALWDRVFGSEIARAEMNRLRESVATVPALDGPSNVRMLLRYLVPSAR